MKRKVVFLFLTTILLFGTGCHSTSTYDSPSVSDNVVNQQDTQEDNTNAPDDAVTEDEGELSSLPLYSLEITTNYIENKTEDNSTTLFYGNYDDFILEANGYDALAEGIAQWQEERLENIQDTATTYTEYAKEDMKTRPDFYGYSSYRTLALMRSDSSLLSFTDTLSDYSGGAHPSYYSLGYTFDVSTGKQLALSDLVKDYDAFSEDAINYILEQLKQPPYTDYGFFEDYETLIEEGFSNVPWYLSAGGIHIIYNTYDIAPYAAGKIEIILPAEQFESYIKEEYLWKNNIGYAAFAPNEVVTIETGSESYSLCLTDGSYDMSAEDGYTPAYLTFNGTEYPIESYGEWYRSAYIVHQENDRVLLILSGDLISNDYVTHFFEVEDGTLREFVNLPAELSSPGTQTVKFSFRVDALGTYSADMTFDIQEKTPPVCLDEEYVISSPKTVLTTIKDLTFSHNGEEITLPAGTRLWPDATDAATYVRITVLDTGAEYTLPYNRDEYPPKINGVDENEYFSNLPYAG